MPTICSHHSTDARPRRLRFVASGATLALLAPLLAACSSSTPASSGTSQSTASSQTVTTVSVATAAQAYTKPGPHPIGVITLTLPKGNKVEVWYPAVNGTTGTDTYDVRDFLPPSIKMLLKGNLAATFTIDAKRGAAVAPGRFPLVLFSHGFSGIRLQSSYLTSHLASWGMIVAAPDHPSRDLYHALQFQHAPESDSVADIEATQTLVEQQDTTVGSVLEHHVDTTRIAAVGHSAGGQTVADVARVDPDIDGYVSLASGFFANTGASTQPGVTTTTAPPPADKPSLFVAGANDHVAVFDKVTGPAYAAAPARTRLWVIDKAGHNAFDDFCTLGGGQGIIGLADASGLGPLLATKQFASFKTLGSDGCSPPDVPVRTVWPIIEHVVTAWLRQLFGVDPAPGVGLGADVANQYAVKVRIEARPG
jgi:dienelactone hydrolase